MRVTDILRPFSGVDKIPPHKLYEKGLVGEALHEHAFDFINGIGVWDPYQNSDKYFESFRLWWEKEKKKHIFAEERFFCDELNITGKVDLVYKLDGKIILADYKTSHAPSKTWMMQGSAYRYLIETSDLKIDRIEFVHLSPLGEYPTVIEYPYNFDQFMMCLEVFKQFFATKEELQILGQ